MRASGCTRRPLARWAAMRRSRSTVYSMTFPRRPTTRTPQLSHDRRSGPFGHTRRGRWHPQRTHRRQRKYRRAPELSLEFAQRRKHARAGLHHRSRSLGVRTARSKKPYRTERTSSVRRTSARRLAPVENVLGASENHFSTLLWNRAQLPIGIDARVGRDRDELALGRSTPRHRRAWRAPNDATERRSAISRDAHRSACRCCQPVG